MATRGTQLRWQTECGDGRWNAAAIEESTFIVGARLRDISGVELRFWRSWATMLGRPPADFKVLRRSMAIAAEEEEERCGRSVGLLGVSAVSADVLDSSAATTRMILRMWP